MVLFVLIAWALVAVAQDKPTHQDAPAPQPTAEVKALLDEAQAHWDAKRADEARQSIERALELANQ